MKKLIFALACGLAPLAWAQEPAAEAAYLAAMDRMMNDMMVEPTDDIDRDFVVMMVPHHQSAIDMARSYLHYGHNEELRRVAQEIIDGQQQEIAVMLHAIGDQSSGDEK
jgi:uncharacterized protein (DUF305 family)